jgi:hypothetical protein
MVLPVSLLQLLACLFHFPAPIADLGKRRTPGPAPCAISPCATPSEIVHGHADHGTLAGEAIGRHTGCAT